MAMTRSTFLVVSSELLSMAIKMHSDWLTRTLCLQYCRDAHSDAVWWSSFSDFVSHSIITFLLVRCLHPFGMTMFSGPED